MRRLPHLSCLMALLLCTVCTNALAVPGAFAAPQTNPQPSAQNTGSAYWGVRLELPLLALLNGGSAGSPPFGGAQIGWDFDSPTQGFGVRASFSTFLISTNRLATDAYYRFRLNPSGANVYAGGGLALLLTTVNFFSADLHALLGIEVPLWSRTSLFVDLAPGVSFAGGGTSSATPAQYVSFVGGLWINIGAGLNFRF